MSEPKFSPGPYEFQPDESRIVSLTQTAWEKTEPDEEDPPPKVIIYTIGAMGGDDTVADANLLAASWEFYEAARLRREYLAIDVSKKSPGDLPTLGRKLSEARQAWLDMEERAWKKARGE